MTDGWCCAYCETVVEPDQEKLSSKGGMKLTCPNCGNSDYQPPAGGAIAR